MVHKVSGLVFIYKAGEWILHYNGWTLFIVKERGLEFDERRENW